MSHKAPSAGTKVTTGENVPVTREAPGPVAGGSLAAESARKGGAFASNPGQEQQQEQSQQQWHPHKTASGGDSSSRLEDQRSYAGAAPTYVSNQRIRDPAGPHGKNLTEGGFEGSGTEWGSLPEPGSVDDPSRLATQGLRAGVGAGAGVASLASQGSQGSQGSQEGKGSDGQREDAAGAGEGGGKTWYTPLGGDQAA